MVSNRINHTWDTGGDTTSKPPPRRASQRNNTECRTEYADGRSSQYHIASISTKPWNCPSRSSQASEFLAFRHYTSVTCPRGHPRVWSGRHRLRVAGSRAHSQTVGDAREREGTRGRPRCWSY